jgi:hypothetical protein
MELLYEIYMYWGKIDTFNTFYLYRRYLIANDGHLKNIAEYHFQRKWDIDTKTTDQIRLTHAHITSEIELRTLQQKDRIKLVLLALKNLSS